MLHVPIGWWELVSAHCRQSRCGRVCVRLCGRVCPRALHIPSPPSATAPRPDSSALAFPRQWAKGSRLGPGELGCWSPVPTARQDRHRICVVVQLDHDLLILSRLLEIFLFQCNTLAVGFGETACSNYSLS